MYRLDSPWSKIVFDDEVYRLNQKLPTSKTEGPEVITLGPFVIVHLPRSWLCLLSSNVWIEESMKLIPKLHVLRLWCPLLRC